MARCRVNWPQSALALAKAIPASRLHPSVQAWAQSRGRAARGPWAVAFSGGADSLALLLLVWAHWPERRGRLVAFHFNHRLRGRASAGDAQFCRRVCRALGISLRTGAWAGARAGASEAAARAARMAFFEQEMAEVGAKALWLGHQQDDIAETILMRLARGSGTAGLAAPRPVQPMPDGRVHLRPLTTLTKAALVAALEEIGVSWREDASNGGADYFRNRVRQSVLPAWRRAAQGREALEGAALARELLEEDDAALEAWVDELDALKRGRLDLGALAGKPVAVWRRALRRWLATTPYRGDLSRQGFAALLAAVQSGQRTRFSLGNEGFAAVRAGVLRFERVRARKAGK
jgi:tRNA(Ile)-lysidine synthase